MRSPHRLHIGTCSWKYDSWRGLVYPDETSNYLEAYSRRYRTVEVDQWFWSLFDGDTAVLPKPGVVQEYAASVPADFIFCVKVPNSITLTHHYHTDKKAPLRPNPCFLSIPVMERFLELLEPIRGRLGPLIFQFEYLNKKKMNSLGAFMNRFGAFAGDLPAGYDYFVETRNPNYLKRPYFDFLAAHSLGHVFLHGYYMPPIFEVYKQFRAQIRNKTVIRLHGPGRSEIEKKTGRNWSRIVAPRNRDLALLGDMLDNLSERQVETFLYVNNHFEGSAPRTISRIEERLQAGNPPVR